MQRRALLAGTQYANVFILQVGVFASDERVTNRELCLKQVAPSTYCAEHNAFTKPWVVHGLAAVVCSHVAHIVQMRLAVGHGATSRLRQEPLGTSIHARKPVGFTDIMLAVSNDIMSHCYTRTN